MINAENLNKTVVNRVSLSINAAKRVNDWHAQIVKVHPGIKIRKQDLVDWLIITKSEELTQDEITSLGEQHYSEVDLANWIVNQLKTAKAKGQELTVSDLVSSQKRL